MQTTDRTDRECDYEPDWDAERKERQIEAAIERQAWVAAGCPHATITYRCGHTCQHPAMDDLTGVTAETRDDVDCPECFEGEIDAGAISNPFEDE
jgi:hypothetical protein